MDAEIRPDTVPRTVGIIQAIGPKELARQNIQMRTRGAFGEARCGKRDMAFQDQCVSALVLVCRFADEQRAGDVGRAIQILRAGIHQVERILFYRRVGRVGDAVMHDGSVGASARDGGEGNVFELIGLTAAGEQLFRRLDFIQITFGRFLGKPSQKPGDSRAISQMGGARTAHLRDGAAVTRFLAWFAQEAPKGDLDEIQAAEKLLACRRETNQLKDIAFPTISGAGANGAIVHYRVTHATNAPIEQNSLYLVDSGAQYLDGTTDITRTLLVGEPTDEHKRAYTLVLKGHIALATARFPKGTTGAHLDVLARQFLWANGLDYAHGTGHGVGSYLGVHEGLARIAKQGSVALEPGMLLSNEPGYYREGAFGIRLENLIFVTEPEDVGGDRPMMGFETITRAPFERRLVETSLMSEAELAWLNAFHAKVLADIDPLLSGDDLTFLEAACAPL